MSRGVERSMNQFDSETKAPMTRAATSAIPYLLLSLLLGGCATTGAVQGDGAGSAAPTSQSGRPSSQSGGGQKASATGTRTESVAQAPTPPPTPAKGASYKAGMKALEGKSGVPDYQTAYEQFQNAAVEDSGNAKAHFNAGYSAEKLGKAAEAIPFYEEAVKLKPDFTDAANNLARAYVSTGRPDKAVDLYIAYLKQHPEDLKARNNLGGIYTQMKNYDKAVSELRTVLTADPNNIQAYRNLAAVYYAQGNYKLSMLLSANASKLAPNDPGVHNNLGVTSLKLGDEIAAIASFKKAIELDKNNREANFNLGTIALRSGDYGLARTCFESILEKLPGDIESKLGYAVALRGQQELDDALKQYDEVLKLQPDNLQALYNLAMVQWKYQQDFDRSLQTLNRYATVSGNKPGAVDVTPIMEQVRTAKAEFLAFKAREEERLAKERAEAERLAKEQEAKQKAEAEAKTKLKTLITTVEDKVKASKLPKAKLDPIRDAIDQSKQVLEEGDMEMVNEAYSYLEGAATELK